MATISLEQIDLLMRRTNVTYTEAKNALEQCDGDVVEALLYLEKLENSYNQNLKQYTNDNSFVSFIDKLNTTPFIMKKKDKIYIHVPLSVALIAIILCFHVSILAIMISLACGIKISFIE